VRFARTSSYADKRVGPAQAISVFPVSGIEKYFAPGFNFGQRMEI